MVRHPYGVHGSEARTLHFAPHRTETGSLTMFEIIFFGMIILILVLSAIIAQPLLAEALKEEEEEYTR